MKFLSKIERKLCQKETLPNETVDNAECQSLSIKLRGEMLKLLKEELVILKIKGQIIGLRGECILKGE